MLHAERLRQLLLTYPHKGARSPDSVIADLHDSTLAALADAITLAEQAGILSEINVSHRLLGIYTNGDRYTSVVISSVIVSHITYNIICRPGRALVIDGILLYSGIGVSENTIRAALQYCSEHPENFFA